MSEKRRVVVTGVGCVSPLGLTMKETWSGLVESRSGIGRITKFNTDNLDVHIAGEVKGFNSDLFVPKKEQKKMDLFIHYSLACTQMALEMSGLPMTEEVKNQTGVIIGVGMGGLPSIEEQYKKSLEKGPSRMSPFFIPMVITNLAAGQVSIAHGFRGPNYSVTSACASSAHSIGEAFSYIRNGDTDVMIAGGAESTVCMMAMGGFSAMRALSTRNEAPERASRPFDQDRDGFVLSEGAAILVLEEYEFAKKRNANILCEISGYGASADAFHMTTPSPEGIGAQLAIRRALQKAALNEDQIDYINAHGTSTPAGDELEIGAIKSVFKDHAYKLSVSSSKSMTGHTLGAAGALESAICVYSILNQIAPPTINLDHPSQSCDIDLVPHRAKPKKIRHALNNSFGFGGTNACVVFSQV